MNFRLSFLLGLLLVGLLVFPSKAVSQEQDEEQEDAPQLPEIAPREIEIRGQLQIAFPSLQRQPLDGFSSDPSLPSVPNNRRPYVEPYKQELENLPESLPELETSTQALEAADRSPARGFLETGSGRYFTRFAEGRLSVPLSPSETFSIHGDYTGTEGFTAYENPSLKTPFDEARATVSFESRREGFLFDAKLQGRVDQYTLYGATPASGTSVQVAPDRESFSFEPSVRFRTRGTVESTLEASYDYTQYGTQFVSSNEGDPDVFDESRFQAQGALSVPIGPLLPRLEARGTHSRLGGDAPGGSAFSLDVHGSLPLLETAPFVVRAGAQVLAFETPADPSQGASPSAQATFVLPTADIQWKPTSELDFYLRNAPLLGNGSLQELYSDNPYAEHAPPLRPSLETTNAEAGLTFSTGPIRLSTSAGYRYAPVFRYFVPGGDARYSEGIFQAAHESARIIHGGGRLALEGFDPFQMSLGISYRDGELTEVETVIPNFSPLVADAMLSYSFANQKGLLQLNGEFKGSRYLTTAQSQSLDPYFSVDLEGSYSVTSTFDLVARADNLSPDSPTLWARYPRPPAMISAGLRIQW